MSLRKRLWKRKLLQAKSRGTDLQKLVPKNMKNKKMLEIVQKMQDKIKHV